MSDIDFSQVKGVRIPQGEVIYIVGHDQAIHNGDGKALLWRRPYEFPYSIGAYTLTDVGGNQYEYFSPYYADTWGQCVSAIASYLPTYNPNIATTGTLIASEKLIGHLLNAYRCNSETDCQNLHIPSGRRRLYAYAPSTYWFDTISTTGKVLVYASKEEKLKVLGDFYPARLLGQPFNPLTGEKPIPEIARLIDTTTPIVKITLDEGYHSQNSYAYTNMIKTVREDYSELVEKYEVATSGTYPKSEYPYLDGMTLLGYKRLSSDYSTPYGASIYAFNVLFRIVR